MSVLKAGERGHSPHLCHEHQGPPVKQPVVLRQVTAQRAAGVAAEHQQGHQEGEGQAHWGLSDAAGLAEPGACTPCLQALKPFLCCMRLM